IAPRNGAVLSADTAALVRDRFQLEDLGPQRLKGLKEPLDVMLLAGPRSPELRRPYSAAMVGRSAELARLRSLCREVRSGARRVALVSGEAGIGKSRLIHALRESEASSPIDWLEWRCSPFSSRTAFRPVVEFLLARLDLASDAHPERAAAALAKEFRPCALPLGETLPLIASLCSLRLPERYPASQASPEARRSGILAALAAWFAARASERPTALIVEDLHWIDPSTQELLDRLVGSDPLPGTLLLFSFRDSHVPTWSAHPVERIALKPLASEDARQLVGSLAARHGLSARVVDQVVERGDGIPLFVEELTHAVLDARADAEQALEIPTTLQGSLLARLDRLGAYKRVAQWAALLGREVPIDLCRAVLPDDAAPLDEALVALRSAGLVSRSLPGERRFSFKHALVQETAARSLLKSQRREAHARIASVLEQQFPELAVSQPEVTARHCREAGRIEAAIGYYRKASDQAMDCSAHAEALSHIDQAVSLLGKLPEEADAVALELDLQLALGAPLAAAKGYGHPDVMRSHTRAAEICEQVGDVPPLYTAVAMLFLYHASRAQMKPASDLSRRLLTLGERSGDRYACEFGEAFCGISRFYEGSFPEAVDHFERARALDARDLGPPDWYYHEHDPLVVASSYGAMALGMVGRDEEASKLCDEAIETGRRASPFNLGFALGYATLVHHLAGNAPRILALAEEGCELCSRLGFPVYLGICTLLKGWAKARLGDPEAGLREVREGMAIGASTGTAIEGPRAFGLLAEVQRSAGDRDGARATVASGLGLAAHRRNLFWSAELERIDAELLLEAPDDSREEAERKLGRGLALARSQGARWIEERILASSSAHRIESR
ncbi:MAG: AAA family ATPase, partial [Myxococcales bacterium]|nr:AAA family ATPase [Myxococcales bacterium]